VNHVAVYAFDVPETLPAGQTAFTEDGAGKPPHVALGMAKSIEVDTP
jgi:hypothetical protein